MIQPTIDELLKNAQNKYVLAVVSAKRARELVDGSPRLTQAPTNKSVSIALSEISEGKVMVQSIEDIKTELE